MNEIITEINTIIKRSDIPSVSLNEVKEFILVPERRIISFFGCRENENIRLYVVSSDKAGKLHITSTLFSQDVKSYESFTNDKPCLHMFEREFYEEFGIEPVNHPFLKPVRKNQDNYEFFEMKGEDVHEVAVGPIHAGVIEPGHFRFMCEGEKVYNLEIMLGYQHRGVEELFLNRHSNRLAESVCGDSVIAYNNAYSNLIETLSGTKISKRAQIIRRIALELERIAVHIGDMGAISGDMAYLQGAAIFGTTRTLVINTMLEISGSRFGRGLIDAGGVNFDINGELSEKIIKMLETVKHNVEVTADTILKTPSCISRLEKTGHVSKETAEMLGAVGMAAKASGGDVDSRFDFKDEFYGERPKDKGYVATGDVMARFCVRYAEIKQSMKYVIDFLEMIKNTDGDLKVSCSTLEPNSFAISIVEGWRGQIVHIGITGESGEFTRYKIVDPSFLNWYMLSMAVRNNGISDFPLCNKSFNLSYSGNDL